MIEWARSVLPEENKLKKNFYAAKSMIKPLSLGYHKINMCPNFCMLYHLENDELTECMTCEHSYYKPRTSTGKTPVTYKKLRYFPITPRHVSIYPYLSLFYSSFHVRDSGVSEQFLRIFLTLALVNITQIQKIRYS